MPDIRKIARELANIQQEVNTVSRKAAFRPRPPKTNGPFVDDECWAVWRKKLPNGFLVQADGVAIKEIRNSVLGIEYTIFVSGFGRDDLRFLFYVKIAADEFKTTAIRLSDLAVNEIDPEIMAEAMDELISKAKEVLKDFPI